MRMFKIFLSESIFAKNVIPDYAKFFREKDPDLYRSLLAALSDPKKGKSATPLDINITIENYLYNPQYVTSFEEGLNQQILKHVKDLTQLKNGPLSNANIPSGKRRRIRIRTGRV